VPPHRHSPYFAAGSFTRGLLCAALGIGLATAQNHLPEEEAAEANENTGFLAGSLLPNGSILKDVLLPSYDKNLKLTSTVRAEQLVIVDRETIDAKNMVIEMFDDKDQPSGRIAMKTAHYLRPKDLLTSDEPVSVVTSNLKADGSGLVFDIDKSRGFLHGPVTAITTIDTRTSMNARPVRNALAAGALLMASTGVVPAQEPPKPSTDAERFAELRLTPADLEKIAADATSKKSQVTATEVDTDAALDTVRGQVEGARITMNGFFQAAALTSLLAEPAPATGDVPAPTINPDPQKTTITSKEGAYFDSKEGLAIFLKDVKVQNPKFQLKGADELKIFMNPEEPDEKPKPAEKETKSEPKEVTPEMAEKMKAAKEAADKLGKAGDGGDFGDIQRLVATGVVEIFYQSDDPKEPPLLASARTVIYDLQKEEILLQGGSPWIVKDGKLTRANGGEAYIRIFTKDRQPTKFVTGNQSSFQTEFSTPEDQKGKDKKKDPKPKAR
jgi:lipopolysaccharide export system protein LptA